MNALLNDVRHAARTLRRTPGFTAVAVLTLALGIGANAAIFTLVDAILIRPLPYPDADRLVVIEHTAPGMDLAEAGQSDGTYLHYRAHSRAFEDMGIYLENVVNLRGDASPERVQVALATRSVFSMLGAKPVLGRLFTEEDERPLRPADAVVPVVLSHGLWQRQYGGDPGIIGRTIELNSAPKLVVGIMEPGFDFPRPETEVWYPQGANPATAAFGGLYYHSVARLEPGVSPQAAEADLNRLIPSLADAYADATPELLENGRFRAVVTPLMDEIVGDVGSALWILLGGVGFVLLIACANIANLFLVRAEHRQREVAVRVALGAGRGDLTRYFLAESALLTALGGALGLALAWAGVRVLVAFGPGNLPRLHEVRLDGAALAFTAGLAVLAALLFGAIPILRYGRPNLIPALRDGLGAATASRERQRARSALVAAQVALALTLLVGATLMVRSFWRLSHVDPGFEPEGVLTMEIALPYYPYPDYAAAAGFWHQLLERVRALPGVEAAGAVATLPLTCCEFPHDEPLVAEDEPVGPDELPPAVMFQLVTPGYFEALRIPLVQGRAFEPGERVEAPNPALVSAALARRLFPNRRVIGRRVRRADRAGRPWLTITGVVGDVPKESVTEAGAEILYIPVLNRALEGGNRPTHMSLAIRTSLPPTSLTPAIRRIVLDIDPAMPIANVRTMESIVADSMARTSFTMLLLLIAAAVALFLGAVGIYGVISYTVGRRTREIGVRIALGARPQQVSRMVLAQGTAAVLAGLAAGVLAALALTGFLRSLLFEVSPSDPITFVATSLGLLGAATLAGWLPARRAARVDPMTALRAE